MDINLVLKIEVPQDVLDSINALTAALIIGVAARPVVATLEATATPAAGDPLPIVPPSGSGPVRPEAKSPSPSDIAKAAIVKEILALGGTPPEKGAVKKFQNVLDELKKSLLVECKACRGIGEATNGSECVPCEGNGVVAGGPATTKEPIDDTAEEPKGPDLEDVRALATAVMRSTPDDKTAGRKKLKDQLDAVGAGKLSTATVAQLIKVVPLLEAAAGVSMADAVVAFDAE